MIFPARPAQVWRARLASKRSRAAPGLAGGKQGGFTLVEVMVAMLIGTVGLLGTIAVQEAIVSASKNANDAAVAMRLATQKIEELSSRSTDTQAIDAQVGLAPIATNPGIVQWYPFDAANNSIPEYVDAEGNVLRDTATTRPRPPVAAEVGRYRWHRQWRVVNTGASLPYVLSVIVNYDDDLGSPKTVRLDMERRKSW
jgi:prepilin-type N-terminal cleavage/methylation domain-containing protein